MVGLVVLAGAIAAIWMSFQRLRARNAITDDAVQWPFDGGELRSLMSRVVAEQAERISSIQDADGRNRARAFLDYYERRRQSVAS
jgi:hypothetical protein